MKSNVLLDQLLKFRQLLDDVTPDVVLFVEGRNRRAGSRARQLMRDCKKLLTEYKTLDKAIVAEIKVELAAKKAENAAKKAAKNAE